MNSNKVVKDFLGCENTRNKHNAALYTRLMQQAMGQETDILIGHHLCFEMGKDINTENEVPSADCLLFDHDIMGAVFGDQAVEVMMHLARTPTESRDSVLAVWMDARNPLEDVYPPSGFEALSAQS
jgi:hypothetical protein